MKTKLIYLIGFIFICILSCSKDDDKQEEPCFAYGAIVTDNCDCIDNNLPCVQRHYLISQTDYNKLLSILNASTKPCVYVDGSEFWDSQEGYLIDLDKFECPDIDTW